MNRSRWISKPQTRRNTMILPYYNISKTSKRGRLYSVYKKVLLCVSRVSETTYRLVIRCYLHILLHKLVREWLSVSPTKDKRRWCWLRRHWYRNMYIEIWDHTNKETLRPRILIRVKIKIVYNNLTKGLSNIFACKGFRHKYTDSKIEQ